MSYLLRNWPEVAARLRNAPAIALFLDFDGTLAPIVARPTAALLPAATRRVLRRLSRLPRVRIWIVSGRRQADLRARIALPRLHYLGLYGAENGAGPKLNECEHQILERAKASLTECVSGIEGVWVEDKTETFAMHFRDASPYAVRRATRALHRVLAPFEGALRIVEGDRVSEVTPRKFPGKGVAVRRLWRASRGSMLPVYLGDTDADEPAFTALSAGITATVGPGRSRARFRLQDPEEVRIFLEKLEEEVRQDAPRA